MLETRLIAHLETETQCQIEPNLTTQDPICSLKISSRQAYLQTIDVKYDTFATPVAEHEVSLQPAQTVPGSAPDETRAPIFSYYVPPPLSPLPPGQSVFQVLREANHAFIYGASGSGKSYLRLNLEADVRTVLDHTLAVTYASKELAARPKDQDHLSSLVSALARDLCIQIIEQFNPLDPPPTGDQVSAFRQQLELAGDKMVRLVGDLLEEWDSPAGVASLWNRIGQTNVRYIPPSEPLKSLLEQVLSMDTSLTIENGAQLFEAGLRAAHLWGFRRILILVDGVDERTDSISVMLNLLKPLLNLLPSLSKRGVWLKFFLPAQLEPQIKESLSDHPLQPTPFTGRIKWSCGSLLALLDRRFKAASPDYGPFDALGDADLGASLSELVTRVSKNSPRRLLSIVSGLIDQHSARDSHQEKIGKTDWNRMAQSWRWSDPDHAPPSL